MFFRISRFGAYAPILYLQRGEQRVVLIGMCHLAESRYFEEVQNILDDYYASGYKVLMERIASERTINAGSSTATRLLKSIHKKELEIVHSFLEPRGIVWQSKVLQIRPSWEIADVEDEGFGKFYKIKVQDLRTFKTYMNEHPEVIVQKYWNLLKELTAPMSKERRKEIIGSLSNERGKILVDSRDDFVAKRILEVVKKSPVVSAWGMFHLQGIKKRLIKVGFQVTSTRWIKFCHPIRGDLT